MKEKVKYRGRKYLLLIGDDTRVLCDEEEGLRLRNCEKKYMMSDGVYF